MSQDHSSTAPAQADSNLGYSREAVRDAIVVGYDGSEHARCALEWAIREARLRHAPPAPAVVVPPLDSYGVPELPNDTGLQAAAQLLTQASRTAREQEPTVRTTPIRMVSPPVQGLLQLAEDAQLLVLGSRGRGGVAGMILGSVSLRVAQRAACPTVVVPATATLAEHHRIVVGLDGSAQSRAALSFAIAEAALRDATVVVVHSVADPYLSSGFVPPPPELWQEREHAAAQVLHEDLEPWRSKHPTLTITATVTHEPAETALAAHAAQADLLVVGTRGRGAFTGLFLGSVSHAALHSATVPVALLHAAHHADS
jgi:nucleotide-binding universal stress UspA family protein